MRNSVKNVGDSGNSQLSCHGFADCFANEKYVTDFHVNWIGLRSTDEMKTFFHEIQKCKRKMTPN